MQLVKPAGVSAIPPSPRRRRRRRHGRRRPRPREVHRRRYRCRPAEPRPYGKPTLFAIRRVASGSGLRLASHHGNGSIMQRRDPRDVLGRRRGGGRSPDLADSRPLRIAPTRAAARATLRLTIDGDQLDARWSLGVGQARMDRGHGRREAAERHPDARRARADGRAEH